jgi:hypothetical protein
MLNRLLLLVLGLSGLVATVGEAHLGHTEAELVTCFGPVESRQAEHALVQGEALVIGARLTFRRDAWRVRAVMIDGRCAKITYTRRGRWTEAHYGELLEANADAAAWEEIAGGTPKWQRTWRRSDGLVAKWMYAGGFIIESHAFVAARHDLRTPPPDLARTAPAG